MSYVRVIGPDDPKYPAIRQRLIITWVKTIIGYLIMGGLVFGALKLFHLHLTALWGFGLIYVFLPIVLWWFSDKIALYQAQAKPADPNNPEHKRVIDIVHQLFKESGLEYEPPVYVSPNPLPNAFATGAIHRKAVTAFTAGLLNIGLTDDEIKGVFAHEFSHVKRYDVALGSFIAALSSLLLLIVNVGVNAWLKVLKLFQPKSKRDKFIPGIVTTIILNVIFWLVSQVTSIVQYFVVRSRESAADAGAAEITGNPCALATALQKLVDYVEKHRPKQQREIAFWRSMRLIMTVDPLYDSLSAEPVPQGVWETIKRWWRWLHLTHPAVPDRIKVLEKMNGGACPRVSGN